MPQPRKATTEHCSFCGEHRNAVPLIVTSQLSPDSACCSDCALTIVHQTQKWAYGVFNQVLHEKQRQEDATKKIITGDGVNEAIKKAGG